MNMRVWGLAIFLAFLHTLFLVIAYIDTGELWPMAVISNMVALLGIVLTTRLLSLWTLGAATIVWFSSGIVAFAFMSAIVLSIVAVLLNRGNPDIDLRNFRKRTLA
jgi:hypothetical protein